MGVFRQAFQEQHAGILIVINPKLVAAATKRDKVLRPILQKLAGQSLRAIAAELDHRGIKSWSGKPWNAVSVRNVVLLCHSEILLSHSERLSGAPIGREHPGVP